MSKQKKKLIIIDGNALIHRSFHALPPTMTTKDGTMVNAVYGFTTVLLKAIKDFKPEYVVLTLDKKGKNFRHEKFTEYKATRTKAPDELYAQIPLVKELAVAFNIPIFEKSGFEADDLIGTITKLTDDSIDNIVVTGDMDTLQLINDHTKVYTMSRGMSDSILYDAEAVQKKYGFTVEQLIDYKALRGDVSDNIPGVRGIGDKTAVELLHNFNSLDGIYKNIDSEKIKDRIRGLLIEHKDEAYMSYELATIKCDVPIEFDLEATRFADFDKEKVIKFLSEMEFKSLLPRIKDLKSNQDGKETADEIAGDKFERDINNYKYKIISEEKDFSDFLEKLKKQKSFTFDTETSGIDPITCDLLGISFSWKEGEAYYLIIKNRDTITNDDEVNLFNFDKKIVENKIVENKISPWLEKLKPIFEDEKIKKNAHNMKFDYRVMLNAGIETRGIEFDTMIASFLLNPGTRQHGLDAVTFIEFGFEKISKEDLLGKGKDKISFSEVATDKLGIYSCEDADFTNRLQTKLKNPLEENDLIKLFTEIEMPLTIVLANMEQAGIEIDVPFLNKMSREMEKRILELEKKIFKHAGTEFNIKSTKQLAEVLFEKMEISTDAIKKTKTGISTAADELEKLKDLHPIIGLIQEYRELTKLTSTYVNALPELVNPKTKRIHTSYNQTVAATGRLSSSDPNLQNIPVRTELGREIRKAFISAKGSKLIALDYSQIELRLTAHLSGDKKMIEAFENGADIHTATAAEINQVKLEEVTKQMRSEAKAINFGVLYGQGAHGLAQAAGVPYWRAKEFIDQYFVTFTGVRKYLDNSIKEAQEKGYAETLLGRRRYLPELHSSVMMVKKAAERMAVNTPVQGTAADMIKKAMVEVYAELKNYSNEAVMLLQVHDELILEVKDEAVEKIAKKVKDIMENVMKLKVPIIVDVKVGDSWGEMEKVNFKY